MAQLTRREEVARVRRESIIDAAERVFFRSGYQAATIDEIVKEAQYSRRTVYIYIKSKAEMYDEVALRAYMKQYEFISSIMSMDPVKELMEIMKGAMRFAELYPGYTSIIVNYHVRLKDSPETAMKELNEWDAKLLGVLEDTLCRGVAEGVFRPDLDSHFAATYFATVFMGVVDLISNKKHYLTGDRGLKPEEFIDGTLKMLMRSVLPS